MFLSSNVSVLIFRYHIGRHVVNLQVARTYEGTHVSRTIECTADDRIYIVSRRAAVFPLTTALILGKAITGIQAF